MSTIWQFIATFALPAPLGLLLLLNLPVPKYVASVEFASAGMLEQPVFLHGRLCCCCAQV